mmetsp:Transcript_89840/g.259075  ORF Transcript_89840/g.259075 Transcript_89840/m.259075 type:complete len:257 (-) Transcript_89840:638-1408(-)
MNSLDSTMTSRAAWKAFSQERPTASATASMTILIARSVFSTHSSWLFSRLSLLFSCSRAGSPRTQSATLSSTRIAPTAAAVKMAAAIISTNSWEALGKCSVDHQWKNVNAIQLIVRLAVNCATCKRRMVLCVGGRRLATKHPSTLRLNNVATKMNSTTNSAAPASSNSACELTSSTSSWLERRKTANMMILYNTKLAMIPPPSSSASQAHSRHSPNSRRFGSLFAEASLWREKDWTELRCVYSKELRWLERSSRHL